ncbi:hypothetical protein [Fulvivirga sediminis]|uniref:Uncharacterized protein n=1 Tax=Fulvivirga sediminis TaxID=2803949 RepID=A0A937FAU3_9BACT|nr:hypothetical protein [Fulvivirga sediminis]MBL3657439.1 hypothetical protein [Fulvivirga sediminis]
MNKLLIIVFILTLSCSPREGEQKTGLLSYFFNISDTENAGVNDVVGFYGGYCEYSIGSSFNARKSDTKYFELKISKSEGLAKYADNLGFVANNVAYRFYRNLNKEERQEYTHINPIIVLPENTENKFEISTWELEIVDQKMVFVDSIVNIIRQKKFDDLRPMLNDSSLVSYDKNELIENLKKYDSQFGNVTDEGFRIFGYSFRPLNDKGDDILFIVGVIMRDIQANEFTVAVNPYSEKKEILLLRYEM